MNDKFKNFFAKIGKFLSNLFFPDNIKCIFCNRDVADFENKPYCDDCEKDLPFNNGNRCQICSEPIANEATVCDSCQKSKRSFKKAFCPFVYETSVRKAILAYKDSNKRYMAKPFAKFIADEIVSSGVKIDVVSFVPLSKKKLSKRSFDQAKLLAEEVAKRLNVECKTLFEKVKDAKTQNEQYSKNMFLSLQRAYAVQDYMLLHTPYKKKYNKALRKMLIVEGRSYADPILDGAGNEDLSKSRRVEVKLKVKGTSLSDMLGLNFGGN